jgi:hypothetical protein
MRRTVGLDREGGEVTRGARATETFAGLEPIPAGRDESFGTALRLVTGADVEGAGEEAAGEDLVSMRAPLGRPNHLDGGGLG